jgi:hypothetical protein
MGGSRGEEVTLTGVLFQIDEDIGSDLLGRYNAERAIFGASLTL